MQCFYHSFKFIYLPAQSPSSCIAKFWRKKRYRLLSPVIAGITVINKMLDRHQLDRGYTQLFQIAYGGRMPQGRISSADLFRDIRALLGKSTYVRFIYHRLVIGYSQWFIIAPVK